MLFIRFTFLFLFLLINFDNALSQDNKQLEDKSYGFQYKVSYKLTFIPDSTNRNDIQVENFDLFLNDSSSLFLSSNFFSMDSMKRAERLRGNSLGPDFAWYDANGTKNTLVVFKNYNKSEVICHDKLAPQETQHFVFPEEDKMNWEFYQDTLHMGGDVCFKATLYFGGREWTAWYNPEIPVADGPYKFQGLPGLIYRISDSTDSWVYELISFKEEPIDFIFNCSDITHVDTSKEEFYKNKINFYKNRIAIMKAQGVIFHTKEAEDAMAKRNQKDNNWIELYP